MQWLSEHSQFLNNQLYVGGESFGGKPVPMIVQQIVIGNYISSLEPKLYYLFSLIFMFLVDCYDPKPNNIATLSTNKFNCLVVDVINIMVVFIYMVSSCCIISPLISKV
jgi:hypothetical protein